MKLTTYFTNFSVAMGLFFLLVTAQGSFAQSSFSGSYEFGWNATIANGVVNLDGSVPNESMHRFLMIRAGEGATQTMQVAKGAPENFVSASIAGLDALKGLQTGKLAVQNDKWTLQGSAENQNIKDDIIAVLELAIDTQTWTISIDVTQASTMVAVETTTVDQAASSETISTFSWGAQITTAGAFRFSGFVPSEELKGFLALRAGDVAHDTTGVGPAAPAGFMTSALAAINALKELESGGVSFQNNIWKISGLAANAGALEASLQRIENAQQRAQWEVSIEVVSVAIPSVPTVDPTQEPIEAVEEPQEQPTPVTQLDVAAQTENQSGPTSTLTQISGDPNYQFAALRADGGPITFSGNLPATAFANYIGKIAGNPSLDAITILAETPDNFRINVITGLAALNELRSGLLDYQNGQWTLVGDAIDNAARASVRWKIFALSGSEHWKLDIETVPALEICKISVAQFTQNKTILFAPASARLTAESVRNVTELATNLNACSSALIYVSGHTDSDGPAEANMALSVARAESVINQLIEAGVSETRLYAVGFGETLPIATNDTRAGKAQNRRIVFELRTQ